MLKIKHLGCALKHQDLLANASWKASHEPKVKKIKSDVKKVANKKVPMMSIVKRG